MRFVLVALLCAGCAAAPPHVASAPAEGAPPPATVEKPAAEPPARAPGTIARCDLEKMLSTSPGAFLSHVEIDPTFRGSRFQGWRIGAFFPGDPRFAGVDLVAGDVVTRVNGASVEQPEQFMHVWEGARFRRDLTVELMRDGVPHTLRWTIVD
jgi:type II secretory pathway component PulC